MKTINGKNKLERQINKAKKYLGISLSEKSNKFLIIDEIDDKENTYIIFNNFKLVKNGELYVVEPLNWNQEKPIFIKNFLAIEDDNFYDGKYLIFKSNNEELKELVKGCDDVFNLYELNKTKKIYLTKN